MTTDEMSFLNAIRESAGDDAPRLIFSDWLEENGQYNRAELIRTLVALKYENNHELKQQAIELLALRETQ